MSKKNIINDFWNDAYRNLKDGGYISNDERLNTYRFMVEKKELQKIIRNYAKESQRNRALDVGCGNGRFSKILARYFERVDAIDIAESIIEENKRNNTNPNIVYHKSTLENWIESTECKYDFIYIGGVLMYIENIESLINIEKLSSLLNKNGVIVLRESVMTKERKDHVGKHYVAYYRSKDVYKHIEGLKAVVVKENLAYRVGELRNVLDRLKLGFLFRKNIYPYLLKCLKCKDLIWKPHLNKLVNYYYIFRKEY